MKRWAIALLLGFLSLYARAQGAYTPFYWQAGDITVNLPNGWSSAETETPEVKTLLLAQSLAESQDRPRGVPIVSLTRYFTDTTPDTALQEALQVATLTRLQTFRARNGRVQAIGYSADNALFGIAQAQRLTDGTTLVLWARGLEGAQADVLSAFNVIAQTYAIGESAVLDTYTYGTLWQATLETLLSPANYAPFAGISHTDDGTLHVATQTSGVVALDASTGKARAFIAYPQEQPFVVAQVAISANAIHVVDLSCTCVRTHTYDQWNDSTIALNTPFANIATDKEGTLYIADMDESQTFAVVRRLAFDGESTLFFEETLPTPPLLAFDPAERLIALSRSDYRAFVAENAGFSSLFALELPLGYTPLQLQIGKNGVWYLSTLEGAIFTFNADGTLIGDLNNPADHLMGIFSGLALGAGDAVYYANESVVRAVSSQVPPNRRGALLLRGRGTVSGVVNAVEPEQAWFVELARNETYTLSAVAENPFDNLDLAMRVIAPNGRETASADNDETGTRRNPFDPQLSFTAPETGLYAVIVGAQSGGGNYTLGYSPSSWLNDENAITQAQGELSEALPTQRWYINGVQGQSITVSAYSEGSYLDTVVRIYNPQGTLIAENDDAEDGSLGFGSKIAGLRTSFNGTYTVEVVRLAGEGVYTLMLERGE
jgi:hypothetical protein